MVTVFLLLPGPLYAGEADVLDVKVQATTDGTYTFSVTVRHTDVGWEHYADRWEIITPDGKVLGTRVLLHPHVGEQPFTRNLAGVKIPEGTRKVIVRARDSIHKYGGKEMKVVLPVE
jgi:hypothetical protein